MTPRAAIDLPGRARVGGHHAFWPCDISVLDPPAVDATRLFGPRQVTDASLLALAVAHDGRFVTVDRTVPVDAVPGATDHHLTVI